MRLTSDDQLTNLIQARMTAAVAGEKLVICLRDRLTLGSFCCLPQIRGSLVAGVTTTEEATESIRDGFATFVITDDVPEAGSGMELLRAHRHLKTVCITERENPAMVREAEASGVNALIFKSQIGLDGAGTFVAGPCQVAQGGIYLPSGVREYVGRAETHEMKMIGLLTDRERAVLTQVGYGLDNASIAEALTTSEETVKTHLKAIRQKVGESDRVRLALLAIRTGV